MTYIGTAKMLVDILVIMESEIENLSRLVEPGEDQVQKYYDLRDRIQRLREAFGES